MSVLAIIPARGGSKGIPQKNIHPLGGKPLLAWSVEHARRTPDIDRVVVSTDDDAIADVARQFGAEVVWRPEAISGDQASSESALLHVLDSLQDIDGYTPDLIVFLQATSPIRQPDDIQQAINTLREQEADSLFSVYPFEGHIWHANSGQVSPAYDYSHRQMRQDKPEELVENGSIYVFKPWVLRDLSNRLGGKITIYRMHPLDSYQIDTPTDIALIEQLMPLRRTKSVDVSLAGIALLMLDFDGVLTDNRVWVDQEGREAVLCHRGDSWGIARLKEAGVAVMVLSTETNPVVAARCRKLDIPYVQGCDNKLVRLQSLAQERGLSPAQIAFVGNDVNDLACLQWVGAPVAVGDAVPAIQQAASLVTASPGGFGAVREVCDWILEARKQHNG